MLFSLTAAAVIHAAAANGKAGFVIIDAGKKAGLAQGQEVCFADATGAKLGCGKVTVLKDTTAAVQIAAGLTTKLIVGTKTLAPKTKPIATAKAKPAPKTKAQPPSPAPDDQDAGQEQDQDQGQQDGSRTPKGGIAGLSAAFVTSIAEPTAYDAIGFDPDAILAGGNPWVSTATVDRTTYGLAFSLRKPLTAKLDLVPVFMLFGHEKLRSTSTIVSSTGSSRTIDVETSGGASTIGAEAQYHVLTKGAFGFVAGGGASIQSSSTTIKAVHVTDAGYETRILRLNSYLHALAVDALAEASYSLRSVAFTFGVVATQPIAAIAKGYSGDSDFSLVDLGAASYALGDAAKAVDHRIQTGIRARIGVEYRF